MALDAGTYTLTVPTTSFVGAAYASVTAIALDAATVGWTIATEELDVIEVGCYITVTTGANTFAFSFNKRQTALGADILLATVTGPAGAAIAVDRCLIRRPGVNPTTGVVDANPWHFNKGDLMRILVTDTSAAGGRGIFYVKCYPTGGVPLARKLIGTTSTVTDIASTT
jgi:hypothetical protein